MLVCLYEVFAECFKLIAHVCFAKCLRLVAPVDFVSAFSPLLLFAGHVQVVRALYNYTAQQVINIYR